MSKKNIEEMYTQLLTIIKSIENPYLHKMLNAFFVEDKDFIAAFKKSSAAKTVHHGFIGGLLEHTLSVTKLCEYYCTAYPILKRDLLPDSGNLPRYWKTKEISAFGK